MRDTACFCCNLQKRLYSYVNSPTETDGHEICGPHEKILSRFGQIDTSAYQRWS